MTVKELKEALQEQPQDAEVYYLTDGLNEVSEVMSAKPVDEEIKEITGDKFVVLR